MAGQRRTSRPLTEHQRTEDCSLCGALRQEETSFFKGGWPQDDSPLPAQAANLKTIQVIKDEGSRKKLIQRCPECLALFLYELDYIFLTNGSEDTETLRRITKEEAAQLRARHGRSRSI